MIKETGVDSLAISIGTVHGLFKSRLENRPVHLRFDMLDDARDRIGKFPSGAPCRVRRVF